MGLGYRVEAPDRVAQVDEGSDQDVESGICGPCYGAGRDEEAEGGEEGESEEGGEETGSVVDYSGVHLKGIGGIRG